MPRDPRAWLLDILAACDLLMDFTKGKTFEDYTKDALLRSGVERQLEIWQTVGTLEGTCSRGNMPMVTHADDDLPSGGTMTIPMGGFTAVRVQTTGKNNK